MNKKLALILAGLVAAGNFRIGAVAATPEIRILTLDNADDEVPEDEPFDEEEDLEPGEYDAEGTDGDDGEGSVVGEDVEDADTSARDASGVSSDGSPVRGPYGVSAFELCAAAAAAMGAIGLASVKKRPRV